REGWRQSGAQIAFPRVSALTDRPWRTKIGDFGRSLPESPLYIRLTVANIRLAAAGMRRFGTKPNHIRNKGFDGCPDGRDGLRPSGESSRPLNRFGKARDIWQRRRSQVASAFASFLEKSRKSQRCRTSSRFRRHPMTNSFWWWSLPAAG